MDYSNMAPGGLIPQLGVASAGIPEDLDFGIEPEAYPHPTTDETEGDVPSYMQDVDPEQEPEQGQDPEQGHEKEVYTVGMVKRCKDGSEWLITHFCEVCQVGLCSLKQYESHCAGKPHAKKMKAMNDNTAAYDEFLRERNGHKRPKWNCDICDVSLLDGDQYQQHLRGKNHEKKMRVRAGNTKVFDYFCDLCGIFTGNNRTVYDAHIEGQKHMKRLYNGKIDLSVADPTEIAYYCETCKIQMDGAQQYISHLSGQQHLRRIRGEIDPDAEMGAGSGLLSSSVGGKANLYWCDVCKIQMSGHQPFEAHMAGAKHKHKVAAQSGFQPPQQRAGQKRGAPQQQQQSGIPNVSGGFLASNLSYTTGVSDPQAIPQHPPPNQPQEPKPPKVKEVIIDKKCDVCHVVCKTQSGWDMHIAGQTHQKKQKMLDALGSRAVAPAGSLARKILDNGPTVQDGKLACLLCDCQFANVEIAIDHFPARKHRTKMKAMEIQHNKEVAANEGPVGWITGVSPLMSLETTAVTTTTTPGLSTYANFVAGGTVNSVLSGNADIDAKLKEARDAAGGGGNDVDMESVDAHVKAFEEAKKDGGDASSKEGTPAGGGAASAEAMDMLVKEISPHDATAIVCDICHIGVSTTQMLENHVVGSKHIRKVIAVAIADGKELTGMKGKGMPFNPNQRGRGGRGRGRGGRGGRGGGPRGGSFGRPVISTTQVMRGDNDGSTHDYMAIKHKPPIGYENKLSNATPGWASWGENRHQPGSGGWTPWTG